MLEDQYTLNDHTSLYYRTLIVREDKKYHVKKVTKSMCWNRMKLIYTLSDSWVNAAYSIFIDIKLKMKYLLCQSYQGNYHVFTYQYLPIFF